jgi:hypothetical protein
LNEVSGFLDVISEILISEVSSNLSDLRMVPPLDPHFGHENESSSLRFEHREERAVGLEASPF